MSCVGYALLAGRFAIGGQVVENTNEKTAPVEQNQQLREEDLAWNNGYSPPQKKIHGTWVQTSV